MYIYAYYLPVFRTWIKPQFRFFTLYKYYKKTTSSLVTGTTTKEGNEEYADQITNKNSSVFGLTRLKNSREPMCLPPNTKNRACILQYSKFTAQKPKKLVSLSRHIHYTSIRLGWQFTNIVEQRIYLHLSHENFYAMRVLFFVSSSVSVS